MEIRRSNNFKNMKEENKKSELDIEFENIFKEVIEEIKGMDPLE